MTLMKRLTLIVKNGQIEQVFYPVFPPTSTREEVIAWLKQHQVRASPALTIAQPEWLPRATRVSYHGAADSQAIVSTIITRR
jgi:hypothetical protein